MTFFLTAWRDKRKTKTKRRTSSQSFASSTTSSSSTTSPQDSGFGNSSFSTVSDQSNSTVGAFTTLSSLSSLSSRQQQHHQKLLLQKGGHNHGGESRFRSTWSADKSDSRNGSSISTLESRQQQHPHHHFGYPSSSSLSSSYPLAPLSPFSAHYERPSTAPLMSRPSPSSSSTRFKAALSRLLLLPRKGDQLYCPPCTAAAASTTNNNNTTRATRRPSVISPLGVATGGYLDDGSRLTNSNGIHHPLQQQHQMQQQNTKKKQQLFHRKHPLLTIKTSTTAPPSVLSPLSPLSPFSSSNGGPAANVVGVLPADPTAPACFPGTGPVDFALKSQQLQQFQPTSSSRRPSLTPSLTPSLGRVTSPTSPSVVSGRHLIPHHHHRNHLHLGGDSMANSPAAGLSSTLLLRRGSVESIAMSLHSLNNGCTPTSTHLLRRGSVESMNMPLHSLSNNGPPSPLWSNSFDYERPTASNWTMPLSGNNDRRSSISGRSMDEMEVVVASSSKNIQDALSSSSVHPFHQPHTASRYENGNCDNDDGNEAEDENDSVSDNLGRFNARSVQQQHKKKPSLSPSMMAHFSQIEKATSSATASKTRSSLGQGYDISTMFQVGPLPTPPISMA